MADRRARRALPGLRGPILADFDGYWGRYERELEAGFAHFDTLPLGEMEPADLWTALQDAYAFHRRGWYIHFEVMYALVANFLAFYGLAAELGLDPSAISRYLAGRPTTYMKTDEELWRLAARARELGVDGEILRGEPATLRARLEAGADGARWWREFEAFLQIYGWRTEETCTMDTPAWIEDPAPPLYPSRPTWPSPRGTTSRRPSRRRARSATRCSSRRAATSAAARTCSASRRRSPPTRRRTSPGGTTSTTTCWTAASRSRSG